MNQHITKEKNYEADLELALKKSRQTKNYNYVKTFMGDDEAEKMITDKLNNKWVEGLTIMEWVNIS